MASTAETLFPEVEGPNFMRSEEIAERGADVLRAHEARLHNLASAVGAEDLHVLYLRNDKPFDPLKDEVKHNEIAKAIKAPGLWRDVTGFDAVVWVRAYFWDQFDDRQRSAVVLHELLHFEVTFDKNEEPKLAIRKHDIEEFRTVVRAYGDWLPDVRSFVDAVASWEKGEPAEEVPLRSVTIDAETVERLRQRRRA